MLSVTIDTEMVYGDDDELEEEDEDEEGEDEEEDEEGGRLGGAKRVGGMRRPWHGMAWVHIQGIGSTRSRGGMQ